MTQLLHAYKDITDILNTEKVIKFYVNSHIDRRKRIAVAILFIVVITISNKNILYNFLASKYIQIIKYIFSFNSICI